MKTTERLLRIAGLLIIIRDEVEDQDYTQRTKQIANQWLKQADTKLREVTGGGRTVNEEYNNVIDCLMHVLSVNGYDVVDNYTNLLKVLQMDLERVKFSGKLLNLTKRLVNELGFDEMKCNLLYHNLKIFEE